MFQLIKTTTISTSTANFIFNSFLFMIYQIENKKKQNKQFNQQILKQKTTNFAYQHLLATLTLKYIYRRI